jgi:APA family basic amino acid/polyamine antiporter
MGLSRIGFWALVSVVINSQIGSGIFISPTILAPYGYFSLAGWVISGSAALCLAIVFSSLCKFLPRTGGPHAYVKSAFGPHVAFFVGWSYWLVSWVSTVVVVIASIGYLSPFIGDRGQITYLTLEIILAIFITILNLRGVFAAGKVGFFLNILKFIPLFLLPVIALFYFKSSNFTVSNDIASLNVTQILGQVSILTMWGFIGVETGTTPAGSVENPSKTIPKALICGTMCVALFYLLNSIGIIGLLPEETLAKSKSPYVDAAQYIFGGNWHFIISIMVTFVCIGTINAWTLISGQIILGLAEDELMPKIFTKRNAYQSPHWGILASSIGIIIILIFTSNENLTKQISSIIDYSVTVFLFVYLICCIATIKLFIKEHLTLNVFQKLCILVAIIFCSCVIYETSKEALITSSLFVLSGLPIYLFWYLRKRSDPREAWISNVISNRKDF